MGGDDFRPGIVYPGIDSFFPYPAGDTTITKLEMVVFEFSQAIRVNSIKVDDVAGFERDVWVAKCASAPTFTQGLTAALAPCTVLNKNDSGSDGPFTHQVGLAGVRFLLVGARPQGMTIGKIAAGVPLRGQFYIDSINFTK